MLETKKEQSWETCKYRFPSKPEDKVPCVSEKYELFESYSCGNENIVKSRIYPTLVIREGKDGPLKQLACFHSVGDHESLCMFEGKILGDDAIRFSVKVKEALRGCTHCKFYEPKEKIIIIS